MVNSTPIEVTPVVLCGGSGSRLWPLSRVGFPKQFLVLFGTTSLFQKAICRVNDFIAPDIKINSSLIVSNEEHRFLVLDQLRELPEISASLLLEPVGRNTAPALTLAALQATNNGTDPILVVTPADQTVKDIHAFNLALQNSIRVAASGSIVVLGVTPNKPNTGYGYIKFEGNKGSWGEYNVAKFTEKPDIEKAQAYLASGQYSWNSGIFVVRASVWLDAIKTFRGDIYEATAKAFRLSSLDQQFIRPDSILFNTVPSESVDYAVIEKCPGSNFPIKMIPLNVSWDDLGTWDAVWEQGTKDDHGNVFRGDTLLENTTDTYVYADHRLVSAVGVNNLVIVETADAVLIANKNLSQDVKKIVFKLEKMGRDERVLHRKVSRPWGWYDTIDIGDRFKVKRIQVNPGSSLSLQKHSKRAEHWVVVRGLAEVTCDKNIIHLRENESTFIPQGVIHRLANIGSEPLEIIEVQSGIYLGEDDIVRIDDDYGRNKRNG
jgi:mannose-1-phosphate guanylyltransferase/mannose-6-phosphate isomerase